jgi:hypothetical protein
VPGNGDDGDWDVVFTDRGGEVIEGEPTLIGIASDLRKQFHLTD